MYFIIKEISLLLIGMANKINIICICKKKKKIENVLQRIPLCKHMSAPTKVATDAYFIPFSRFHIDDAAIFMVFLVEKYDQFYCWFYHVGE